MSISRQIIGTFSAISMALVAVPANTKEITEPAPATSSPSISVDLVVRALQSLERDWYKFGDSTPRAKGGLTPTADGNLVSDRDIKVAIFRLGDGVLACSLPSEVGQKGKIAAFFNEGGGEQTVYFAYQSPSGQEVTGFSAKKTQTNRTGYWIVSSGNKDSRYAAKSPNEIRMSFQLVNDVGVVRSVSEADQAEAHTSLQTRFSVCAEVMTEAANLSLAQLKLASAPIPVLGVQIEAPGVQGVCTSSSLEGIASLTQNCARDYVLGRYRMETQVTIKQLNPHPN